MLFVDNILTCPEVSSRQKGLTDIIAESVVEGASRDFLAYGLERWLIQLALLLIIPTEVILELSVSNHLFLSCFDVKVYNNSTR